MQKLLDEMITECLQNNHFVGANAAVYQDSQCVYANSFGMADKEQKRTMTMDSIFRIYSMTKPVTAIAAMQLIEQGKIHPDFPISWYLPEFKNCKVWDADTGKIKPALQEIRIQDMLNMTSGLCYPGNENPAKQAVADFYAAMDKARKNGCPIDTIEYCKRMAELPLAFEPGTHWDYGTSADILGGLIQKVSDMNYRDYLMQHIFKPLGMTDTDFYVPDEKKSRFTATYTYFENQLVRDENCYLGLNDYKTLPAFISGGAGLCSTIPDYAKLANALANGGTSKDGIRIISEKALQYMRTPQVNADMFKADQNWDSLKGYSYGSLVRVLTNQKEAGTIANLGEFGWDGWTGTYFCVDPAEKLSVFFWIQVAGAGTSNAAKLMRNIVYAHL